MSENKTESKWETIIQKMMKNGWSEQSAYEMEDYLTEAYEKGKEEGIHIGEKAVKNALIDTEVKENWIKNRMNEKVDEAVEKYSELSRLQTLEEVEKKIEEIIPREKNGYSAGGGLIKGMTIEDHKKILARQILKTIKEMKK